MAVKIQPRAGAPTVQMAPAARERRPPVGTRGSAKPAPMTPGFANVSARPSRRLGPAPPRPCGPLCRPPPGELARGRRSRACASSALLGARRNSIFTATGPPWFCHRRLTALHRGTAGLRPASPPKGRRECVTPTARVAPGSALHDAIYLRKAVRPLTRRSRSSRSCEVS